MVTRCSLICVFTHLSGHFVRTDSWQEGQSRETEGDWVTQDTGGCLGWRKAERLGSFLEEKRRFME